MRVNFRTSKSKLKNTYFCRKKRTAVFSFKKRTKYGKNVLVGSSVWGLKEEKKISHIININKVLVFPKGQSAMQGCEGVCEEKVWNNLKCLKRCAFQCLKYLKMGVCEEQKVWNQIKIWAKGEGNCHFYHIEIIDLPFHRITFVSCFRSLINRVLASPISVVENNCE